MFQTKVEIPTAEFNIGYEKQIICIGSCFAENIGRKLKEIYFEADINPFGVLYNPVSISNSINLLLENKPFGISDLVANNDIWQSFMHSSLFSATSAEQCLKNINERFNQAVQFLQNTDYLLITFGTAWIYQERKSGKVVSNCHKLPANEFLRRRLTTDEIVSEYSALINKVNTKFPNLKLIFTLSPIRHWKDGAHENNISKSTLLLAIETLQKKNQNVHYFPAYEIQMDELRDYRFYASDMLHPSDLAIDYIWQRFGETYFDARTQEIKKEIEKLVADLAHRPIHPETDEYKKFSSSIEQKKIDLKIKYPFLKKHF